MSKNRVVIEFTVAEIATIERAFIWADSYLWNYYNELKISGKLDDVDENERSSLRDLSKRFNKLKDDINKISEPLFTKREKLLKERDERNTKRFWKSLGIG